MSTTHRLSTDVLFRLMLAECATVRELLEVASVEDALAKITTDSEEGLTIPRVIILESDFKTESTDESFEAQNRSIAAEIDVYVPESLGATTRTEEKTWLMTKVNQVDNELMALRGTGEPMPGVTHLWLIDPEFIQPMRFESDDRDSEETDPRPDSPRWVVILKYELV